MGDPTVFEDGADAVPAPGRQRCPTKRCLKEAAAALAAVGKAIFGRTTDPVRMYMLWKWVRSKLADPRRRNRNAKRIERRPSVKVMAGHLDVSLARSMAFLLNLPFASSKKWSSVDIFSGYIDPDDDGLSGWRSSVIEEAPAEGQDRRQGRERRSRMTATTTPKKKARRT